MLHEAFQGWCTFSEITDHTATVCDLVANGSNLASRSENCMTAIAVRRAKAALSCG